MKKIDLRFDAGNPLVQVGKHRYQPTNTGFIAKIRPVDDGEDVAVSSIPPCIDFGELQRQLSSCRHNHNDHKENLSLDRVEYFKFFRVINCHTRRIIPARLTDDYVALGYIWGGPPEEQVTTPGFLPSRLPAVIEDAIKVTIAMGLQYLWIDRYCILQDDIEDKMHQISNMDIIYINSQFAIIAAAGSDPNYDLPGVGNRVRKTQPSLKFDKWELAVIPCHPQFHVERSTWMTHGWTYQEAILSRRRLTFTDQQVCFECKSVTYRERVPIDVENFRDKHPNVYYGKQEIFSHIGASPIFIKDHIASYSNRNLTYPSDILNGMLGIVRAYPSIFKDDLDRRVPPYTYHIWGIPLLGSRSGSKDIIPESVYDTKRWTLQFVTGPFPVPSKPTIRRDDFPTWSWCGWMASVEWFDGMYHVDPKVDIRLEIRLNDQPEIKSLEEVMETNHRFDAINPSIFMDARVIHLRFIYLQMVRHSASRILAKNSSDQDFMSQLFIMIKESKDMHLFI